MKLTFILLFLFPLFLFSQVKVEKSSHFTLSFEYFKKDMTDIVKGEIDNMWDLMENKSEVEFHLLSKQEKKS